MKFVLQPCKVRGTVLVATRDPSVELSWQELVATLGVTAGRAVTFLAGARMGGHLGVRATPEGPAVFYVETPGGRGNLQRLMEEESVAAIQTVYRVERVDRAVSRFEAVGEGSFQPVCLYGSTRETAAS